jgi:preprotein translocase subunit YajC
MPQQKRFKEHAKMLSALKKGDKVTTSGGLVGKVHKIVDDTEVVIDLGEVKVTALRSAIQGKTDLKPANDSSKKPAAKKAAKPKKKA